MTAFGVCTDDGCTKNARHVTVDDDGQVRAWCYDHAAHAITGGPVRPRYSQRRPSARGVAGAVSSALEVVTWVACASFVLAAFACLLALGLTVAGFDAYWGDTAVIVLGVGVAAAGASWGAQQALERAVLARAAVTD